MVGLTRNCIKGLSTRGEARASHCRWVVVQYDYRCTVNHSSVQQHCNQTTKQKCKTTLRPGSPWKITWLTRLWNHFSRDVLLWVTRWSGSPTSLVSRTLFLYCHRCSRIQTSILFWLGKGSNSILWTVDTFVYISGLQTTTLGASHAWQPAS